jgi:hypothetical protein
MTDVEMSVEALRATAFEPTGNGESWQYDPGPEQSTPAPDPQLYTLEPLDWAPILADGVPRLQYLLEPYLPARRRIWGVGPAEAGKSIWAAWQATQLTRLDLDVAYVSQENGLEEEARRFIRLGPAYQHLRLYVDQGLDLALPAHVGALFEAAAGCALLVLDTLSACWSGDENSNVEIGALDRDVLKPLAVSGTSSLVLDHTGNPQAFVKRRGVHAPRGASSKGQKADHLLEFRAAGLNEFTLTQEKARGAQKELPIKYRVVDAEDGDALALEVVEATPDELAADVADEIVELIVNAGDEGATKTQLRGAAKALGRGSDAVSAAFKFLDAEDPPRVVVSRETVQTAGGRHQANVYRVAPEQLFANPDADLEDLF